jgi:hypothetical protein
MATEKKGLESFIGKRVLLLCGNYFYAGTLRSVSESDAELADASIVYETGEWSDAKYRDAQELGDGPTYVRLRWVEAYRRGK